ncbi:MAG: acyl-CoA dehydrogenase [Acidiferrobacteraceae bacterium]|nr:acyl-CoA dehydrogenase [Acidiferrobacteraceae bacterium]|tara:strand:- start:3199 stop:4977 length:1779 start_codon:yes stop_codon:yes gene_type:complete
MISYKAPIGDLLFLYEEVFDPNDISNLTSQQETTTDLVKTIWEEGAKFCEDQLVHINRSGDEEGCHFNNGAVRTPEGFKEAYSKYVASGWSGLTCEQKFGGQGLPNSVNIALEEMLCSANLAFSTYPGLTRGVYRALRLFGAEPLKKLYLPKLVNGEWSGTMCLTEPHCGTDLGLLRTKAIPTDDDNYLITGSKIFITAGEHDLTENIVHLVLARLPDAPKGIKGVSLFLAPKYLPNNDGTLRSRNSLACTSIEHKMGINASATCAMNFDQAVGWLVGEPNKGMQAMFTMMNDARLGVGMQGLGIAEISYQAATTYAESRLQGRSLAGSKHPEKPADPLVVHPDIRRMLLTMRSFTEGARALTLWVARHLDFRDNAVTVEARQSSDDFVQVMTPIVKAFLTDLGFDITNIGLQIHGGHGYIRETGVEQYVRDARITQIYEGANGIQALDLVGRKLPAHAGRYLRSFFHPVQNWLEKQNDNDEMQVFVAPISKAFGRLQIATGYIAQSGQKNPEAAAAAATEYLRLFGLVALGYMWGRIAETSLNKQSSATNDFYLKKLVTAKFFTQHILPETGSLFASIMSGSETIINPPIE